MRVPADLPVGVIHDESERPDLDIADVEHMDVAPAPVKAKPRLGWWVLLIVFGGLIGLASAIDVFAHDRLVSLLGVILAAALVLAGLWTRPGADAGTGP